MAEIKVIGVVGSGQMGSGISQISAVHASTSGFTTLTPPLSVESPNPSAIPFTVSSLKVVYLWFGKTIIRSQDFSGFIMNRILMSIINEAFLALYSGVATREDIDLGMKLGTNHPMCPLELADLIGLDVCLSIMEVLYAGLSDSKYVRCPLLIQYVDAGRLRGKRGIGFTTTVRDLRSPIQHLGYNLLPITITKLSMAAKDHPKYAVEVPVMMSRVANDCPLLLPSVLRKWVVDEIEKISADVCPRKEAIKSEMRELQIRGAAKFKKGENNKEEEEEFFAAFKSFRELEQQELDRARAIVAAAMAFLRNIPGWTSGNQE